jgi:hypothetical protein
VKCREQDQDYRRGDDKRISQLRQIKTALNLLSKFGLKGKYGNQVKKSIQDITTGLCREFDHKSKWVTVANKRTNMKIRRFTKKISDWKDSWRVYGDNGDNKALCVSKIKYTLSCTGTCDIRSRDKRLLTHYKKFSCWKCDKYPRVAKLEKGHKSVVDLRLTKSMFWNGDKNLALGSKKMKVVRHNVQVYVVPDCNCHHNRNKKYDVKHNVHKNQTKPNQDA